IAAASRRHSRNVPQPEPVSAARTCPPNPVIHLFVTPLVLWYSRRRTLPPDICLPVSARQTSSIQLSWTTVTYRSVLITILVALGLIGFVAHLLFPEQTGAGLNRMG